LATSGTSHDFSIGADGTATGPGSDGKAVTGQVAFLVGGKHREEALVRLADGRTQVFPVAFDVDRGASFEPLTELAGGAPPPRDVVEYWTRVGRNADLACYGCHATGQTLEVVAKSPSGEAFPGSRWVEPGVGCEGCHGPGGPHVDAARGGKPSPTTVRMPRGGGVATVDACAACHGLRDVLPSPFRAEPAHAYGEALYASAEPVRSSGSNAEFREALFTDLRPSTYQQEAVAFSQSGCALRGGLTCTACHDVHSGADTPELSAADGGNGICAPCHATTVAMGEKHTLHAAGTSGSRCLDCHMARILRGPGHEPARDHSMAPPVAGRDHVPAACATCHAGSTRSAAVATAWKAVAVGTAARRRMELGTDDPAKLAAIAGDDGRGWFLRWAALEAIAPPKRPAEEPVLSPIRRALGDANPAVRRAAVRALARCGAPSDVDRLQSATEDQDPWTALEAAHGMGELGAPTAGARLLQLMKRPDLIAEARAQYAYGHACLVGQDAPRAEAALRRALELNPMMVGAINDLGLSLIAQGKREPAVESWRRALDINPRFTAARRNLESVKEAR
jgi:predicted CXXCH cytochrome family protein